MKKIKIENKLGLNKQIISNLNENEMDSAFGGGRRTDRCSEGCVTTIPCNIRDDSRPVLCSPDLPESVACITIIGD